MIESNSLMSLVGIENPPQAAHTLAQDAHGNDEQGFFLSAKQAVCIVKVHWRKAVAAGVLVVAAVAGVFVMAPKTYSSIATLLIDFNSQDPLASKEVSDLSAGGFMPTQIELMQSDVVLDAVSEKLGLKEMPEYTLGNRGGEDTLNDWISAKLRRQLDIEPGRSGSQLIYITASASNARLAADIANAVAESYLAQHFLDQSGPTTGRAERYTEELKVLQHKVEDGQKNIADFRKRTGAISSGKGGVDLESELLVSLEHRLLEARNSLRSISARGEAKKDVTTSVLSAGNYANLRAEGSALAVKMAQLRTDYGPNHPDVQSLQAQIDANKEAQIAAKSAFASATTTDQQVAAAEVESLERAVSAQRDKVAHYRQMQDQASKLEIELDSAQSVYKKALDGYDQERFAAGNIGTHIRLAGKARVPVAPSKPSLKKYLILSLVAAILAAAGTPFLFELPRRKIRCHDDIERDFGVPILVEFPSISIQRELRSA